jgi:hypothetical protein
MLIVLLVLQLAQTYKLTVIGGTGSGVYACAATVPIVANRTKGAEVFSQWTTVPMGTAAIEHHHQRKATVKNHGCADLTAEAHFTAKPRTK